MKKQDMADLIGGIISGQDPSIKMVESENTEMTAVMESAGPELVDMTDEVNQLLAELSEIDGVKTVTLTELSGLDAEAGDSEEEVVDNEGSKEDPGLPWPYGKVPSKDAPIGDSDLLEHNDDLRPIRLSELKLLADMLMETFQQWHNSRHPYQH